SSGRAGQSRRTSAEEPIRKVTFAVEIPRRPHSPTMRSASSCDGVTASWWAPHAAKTIVLAPAPVSSVAIPGCTVRSMNASASHASPQNSDRPCSPGGAARRSSVSDMRGSYRLGPMAARRALITGIAGQDGSLLAELLLDEGYEVVGIVRRATSEQFDNLAAIRERIELVQADLLDELSLVDALRQC